MTSRPGPLGLPWILPTWALVASVFLGFGATPSAAEWTAGPNSIHAGATSVQFLTFGGGSVPFTASGLYMKSHFSDRVAVRIGTDFGLSETSGHSPNGPLPQTQDYRSHYLTLSAEIEEYVDATGPVTIFLGLGPYWTRRDYTAEGSRYDTFSSITYFEESRQEIKSWVVGGTAAVGFEWFFKRRLSVLGRVGGAFGFGKQDESTRYTTSDLYGNVIQDDRRRLDSDTATASSSTAALGLGLYF